MREHYALDWAFAIRGTIERIVRAQFPGSLRSWPLLTTFEFEAFSLASDYVVLVLRDRLSGIPAGSPQCKPFPYPEHPPVPPEPSNIDLWQFFLRDRFSLREEDASFLIPVRDCGKNSPEDDYKLFSPAEQMFWSRQVNHHVSRYKAYIQSMSKEVAIQPLNVTYNVQGSNARVNVGSLDASTNIAYNNAAEIFGQVAAVVSQIEDLSAREKIRRIAAEMEASYGGGTFVQKYQAFISAAADHMTLLAPVIPALTSLLS